jgi:hypothetical protein
MDKKYYIVKLQNDQLLVWYPKMSGFYRTTPTPYFSMELAKRVYNRITLPVGRYNRDYVQIVDLETFVKLQEEFPKWTKRYKDSNIIRGNNYSDKGEIRGANYNDKGHTEVGETGWMKYSKKLYNTKSWDIQERDS